MIVGSPVRKFDRGPGGRHDAPLFCPRNHEPESVQRMMDFRSSVGQVDNGRRNVSNAVEKIPQGFIDSLYEGATNERRSCQDDDIDFQRFSSICLHRVRT